MGGARKDERFPALSDLLGTHVTRELFEDCWHRDSLLMRAAWSTAQCALLELDDVRDLIGFTSHAEPATAMLVRASQSADLPMTSHGRPDILAIGEAFDQGWSIVVNGLHLKLRTIADLCKRLSEELEGHVHVNMYFTPASGVALLPHADTHDVFIVQIAGQKTWNLFEFRSEDLGRAIVDIDTEAVSSPSSRVMLERGDVLYVPTGMVHGCHAGQSSVSLHLTVGVELPTWLDYMHTAVDLLAESFVVLRDGPYPGMQGSQRRRLVEKYLEESGRKLSEVAHKSVAFVDERPSVDEPRAMRGYFADLAMLESIRITTEVSKRPGSRCRVQTTKEGVELRFGFGKLGGPLALTRTFEFIASHRGSFRIGGLPDDITDDSKVLVVRALVKEGLLNVSKLPLH